jgi:creatinine amidohydrolase
VEPYSELEIEYLSWPEVSERLSAGYKTAVFAVGSLEQHGTHLPITTDALIGTAIARRVTAHLGDALMAPTMRPGNSSHHMGFPGTITLRPSTLSAVIVDYCTSLANHGFTTIVVISAHGGNNSIVQVACMEAQELLGKKADIIPITQVMAYNDSEWGKVKEGYHATSVETSCVMALAPELVHLDRASDWTNPIDPNIKDISALLSVRGTKYFAPQGIMGRPTSAKAEIGEVVLDRIGINIAAQVKLVKKQINEK